MCRRVSAPGRSKLAGTNASPYIWPSSQWPGSDDREIWIDLTYANRILVSHDAWRPVAKDGIDLAADRATLHLGSERTYDFELAPTEPADLRLTGMSAVGQVLADTGVTVLWCAGAVVGNCNCLGRQEPAEAILALSHRTPRNN